MDLQHYLSSLHGRQGMIDSFKDPLLHRECKLRQAVFYMYIGSEDCVYCEDQTHSTLK